MFLSQHPNGTYYLFYRDETGNRHKVSTKCKTKALAMEFLRQFRSEEHQRQNETRNILLSDFSKEYLSYVKGVLALGTYELHELALRALQIHVGDIPLRQLTPRHFDELKARMLKGIQLREREKKTKEPMPMKPVTVNMRLKKLKACFNVALSWKLLESNPLKGVQMLPVSEQAPIFLTKADFQKLLSVIEENWLKEVVLFATLTGLRRGELINLRWQDVDLQRRLIHIHSTPTFRTKQGRRRVIPLNNMAFYLLQSRHGKDTSDYVFTLNGKQIFDGWLTHAFKKTLTRAKLEKDGLHFHSLRHTFASWLVQDGVSLYEVQKLLGHSSSSVTEIYSHLQPEQMHSTVNRIELALN